MFHRAPLIRHDFISVFPAADDDIFGAPTAFIWKGLVLRHSQPRPPLHQCLHQNLNSHRAHQPLPEELSRNRSQFTASVILHGISTKSAKSRPLVIYVPPQPKSANTSTR